MSIAIACRALRKIYPGKTPVEAVRGLDLTIHVGECFGLLGPNGAGKTTTLEILEGLLEPSAGEVELFGLRWDRDEGELRQKLGISLQQTQLADKLTVAETVRLFRSFYRDGLTPQAAIERVSLQEKARSYVVQLSGGQKQRLAVACALVGNPELLFLDEPTTGLDPQSRRQLWEVIRDFRNQGKTVVLTTHYMDEAERLCDRVAIIDHGQVIALGTPKELIARLGGEHVIEFRVLAGQAIEERLLGQVESLRSSRVEGDLATLTVHEPHRALPSLLKLLQSVHLDLASLTTRHANLEDVFVNLTGRNLREGASESS